MIIIVGNGIAGVTAARYIRKGSDEEILIISSESKYFFSRTALMYVYMGHMKFEHTQPYEPYFWEKNNIQLLQDHVNAIKHDENTITTRQGKKLHYDKLILATGSRPNKFGWKGQDADGVSGLYSKQDLEYIEAYTQNIKEAVIVGGGLIGIELAEMLLTRNIKVHFLIREKLFWNSVLPEVDANFIMKHIKKHHNLIMCYEEELEEIITLNGKANRIKTKNGKIIDCQFVGLTAGVSPNIDFVKTSAIECNRGILIDRDFKTNIDNIYAIGDCAEFRDPLPGRRPIEQVWYTGKFMGECLGKSLSGTPTTYNPGHWFNSAKFFDLEYQTYGVVTNKLRDNEDEFIFVNNEKEVLLHFVYDKETLRFIGVNTFGMRLRHQVFNEWLLNNVSILEVVANIGTANFDPEFYRNFDNDIVRQFNESKSQNVEMKSRVWWQSLLNN